MDGRVQQVTHRSGLTLHPRIEEARAGHTVLNGVRVVPPARAVVRTTLTAGLHAAVVAADRALHMGLFTMSELVDEVALISAHQGRARAEELLNRVDAKAESVHESLTRLTVQDLGFVTESQVVLTDEFGAQIARCDLLVGDVVVECDGRIKYQRKIVGADGEPRPLTAAEASAVIWEEKKREDRIRRRGYGVVRVTWSDLDRPGQIANWIHAAQRDARRTRQGP